MLTTLRPYQQALIDDLHRMWADGIKRVLLYLPTGAGKTEVAKHLARQTAETGGCTLFVVERRVLAVQTEAKMRGALTVGVLAGDSTLCHGNEHVIVATVQTLRSRWDWPMVQHLLSRVRLAIVDETHIWHKHHDELLSKLANVPIVGLTATPLRAGLGKRYEHLLLGPNTRTLTDQGYLVQARYFSPNAERVSEFLAQVGVATTGDFATGQLSAKMRERVLLGDVVGNWQAKAENRPTLCFGVDIAHSKALTTEFLAAGIPAAHIDLHTDTDERSHLFADFATGRLKVLSSVYVLTLGFDMPIASCLVIARPTLSQSLHLQMLGRVLRPAEGKTDALVFDHALNVLRHGRAEDFEPPLLSAIDKSSDLKKRDTGTRDVVCPRCDAILRPGTNVCHECGHELSRRSNVHHLDAELVEDRTARTSIPLDDLSGFYRECLWVAEQRGHKPGWAWHQLRERYGEDVAKAAPTREWQRLGPAEPTLPTLRWLKSRQIAYAKARAKAGATQRG